MAEAIEHARQQWRRELSREARELSRLPKPRCPFTIALSREAGTNAEELARRLADELGWTVYDHELVEHIAADAKLRMELVESLDERPAERRGDLVRTLLTGKPAEVHHYVTHLTQTLAALAARGECVIVGRGASSVLPVETTLAVRLVAPLRDRIAAVQARKGLSPADAKQWVESVDRQRRDFVQQTFHRDVTDAAQYDLVLNVARLTQEQCVAVIVTALQKLQST
jgi:cytidylate kinase